MTGGSAPDGRDHACGSAPHRDAGYHHHGNHTESDGGGHVQQCGVPPSAAGHLQPYGVRATLCAGTREFDLQPFLVAFLEEVAAGCIVAGATLIGHLKCVVHLSGGVLACNLTSPRAGARCSSRPTAGATTLQPGEDARLELAVLAYGVPAAVIDSLVRSAMTRLLAPVGVAWVTGQQRPEPQPEF